MSLRFALLPVACLIIAASMAQAEEAVLYVPAPGWVALHQPDLQEAGDGPAEVVNDWQYRFEGGVVRSYRDRIVRIDNPQALMEEGTLRLDWAPDKGDLAIHRLEIIRKGEVIDLIARGLRFDVLRRENMLEARMFDGYLTATLAVPGLEVGDLLRVAYSVSVDDQALGDEVQMVQPLLAQPWQTGFGRVIVSWPEDEPIRWAAGPDVTPGTIATRDGYRYLEIALPVAKRQEMPFDAPARFLRSAMLQAGSFADWRELSRVMAPHFEQAAAIAPDGAVAQEVARIAGQSADPLERAAMAVRLVQDRISYLFNGLDGGNYLPQPAEDTWARRYGDCKAKSVLLLAMLRALGIEAQAVLVASEGGDALPYLLPMPADFDHMIVRARIGGVDYWLDGTSAGTRMHNIADVPPFHHALPLTPEGTDLVPMVQRSKSFPDMVIKAQMDHSASVDLPFLFRLEVTVSGVVSTRVRAMADEKNPEVRKQLVRLLGAGQLPGGQAASVTLAYDDDQALGTIVVEGVADADFTFENGRFIMGKNDFVPGSLFAPDRARKAWQDIPVLTAGPMRLRIESAVTLPDGGRGFALAGAGDLDESFANTRTIRHTSLDGASFRQTIEMIQDLGEIAPAQVPAERRAAQRIANSVVRLEAPQGTRWRWELPVDELARRVAPIRKAYDAAVGQADADDFEPLVARARFRAHIFDYEGAIADYSAVLEEQPSPSLLLTRAGLREALGRTAEAIADVARAYDLAPDNATAFYLAELMAREGQGDAALALLGSLPVSEEDQVDYVQTLAMVQGYSGRIEEGLAAMSEQLATRPDDADLLNAVCWYRGIFKVALDDALGICTRAVELARDPSAALDSRAMVRFRLGQYREAIADLDAVLAIAPWLSPSRYLRGVVSLAEGDEAGRDQLAMALRQSPHLGGLYAHYGIRPGH